MNVLVKTTMILTDIVDMDADDRTVMRLSLRSYLRDSASNITRSDYINRAARLLEQLDKENL